MVIISKGDHSQLEESVSFLSSAEFSALSDTVVVLSVSSSKFWRRKKKSFYQKVTIQLYHRYSYCSRGSILRGAITFIILKQTYTCEQIMKFQCGEYHTRHMPEIYIQQQTFELLPEHRFIPEFTHFSHVIWILSQPSILPVQTIS